MSIYDDKGNYLGIQTQPTGSLYDLSGNFNGEFQVQPEKKSVGGFAKNVVGSGAQAIGNIANLFLHPVQSAQGIGQAIAHPVATSKAIVEPYKLGNIGNTLYTNPVGVALDLSTLLGGVGAGLKVAEEGSTLAKIGQVATKAGEITNPLHGAGKLGGKMLSSKADLASEKLINTGLKIPASQARAGVGKFVLENRAGYKTAQGLKDFSVKTEEALQPQIEAGLKTITAKNGLSLKDIALQVTKEFNDKHKTRFQATDLINDVRKSAQGHEYIVNKGKVGGIDANALRQGLDNALKTEKGKTFTQSLPLRKQLLQSFTHTLRENIKEKTATKSGFAEQSGAITTKKAVRNFQNKELTQGRPGMLDVVSFIGGGPLGVAAERTLRSGFMQRVAGQAIYDLKSFTAFLAKKAPAERLKYLNLLSKAAQESLGKE